MQQVPAVPHFVGEQKTILFFVRHPIVKQGNALWQAKADKSWQIFFG
jgi:hypothetical protein